MRDGNGTVALSSGVGLNSSIFREISWKKSVFVKKYSRENFLKNAIKKPTEDVKHLHQLSKSKLIKSLPLIFLVFITDFLPKVTYG